MICLLVYFRKSVGRFSFHISSNHLINNYFLALDFGRFCNHIKQTNHYEG